MELLEIHISTQQAVTWLGGAIIAGAGAFWGWVFMRGKLRAETGKIKAETQTEVVEQYDRLVERLNKDYDRLEERLHADQDTLLKRIERNTETISDLEKHDREKAKKIKLLEKDNEECKFQHSIVELELKMLRLQNTDIVPHKQVVCVLDDDDEVLVDFRAKFEKIAMLEFCGFADYAEFVPYVIRTRPEVLVLDYRLNFQTAGDILAKLPYAPEVFVMSSGPLPPDHALTGENIRFFLKDEHYIYKIAAAIIKYFNARYEVKSIT